MNVRTKLAMALVVCAGVGVSNVAMAACPTPLTLPGATAQNSIVFGDAISYSLPILGLDVQSSPGQISDCIVVMTGAGGQNINTNVPGSMDNAYQTPGPNPYFRTGDASWSPDPGGLVPEFTGDQTTPATATWDTRLSALSAFLGGNDLVFYFNHNQTSSGGAAIDQDLFIWAQIRLHDDAGHVPDLYLYVTSVPNTTGLNNFGASPGSPYGDPLAYTGPQADCLSTYPSGAAGGANCPTGAVGTGAGSGDATFMVQARGQVCLNAGGTPVPCSSPTAVTTVNHNLGADHVANAVVFPELNTILNAANFNGYDVMQMDIRMGCNATFNGGSCSPGSVLNNGFEQLFIAQLTRTPGPPGGGVPEPATLALVGVAMLGAAMGRRRKLQ